MFRATVAKDATNGICEDLKTAASLQHDELVGHSTRNMTVQNNFSNKITQH
jgi:hypothetical protein